jgi:hypothetical protein
MQDMANRMYDQGAIMFPGRQQALNAQQVSKTTKSIQFVMCQQLEATNDRCVRGISGTHPRFLSQRFFTKFPPPARKDTMQTRGAGMQGLRPRNAMRSDSDSRRGSRRSEVSQYRIIV